MTIRTPEINVPETQVASGDFADYSSNYLVPDPQEARKTLQAEQARRSGIYIAKIRMLCTHCEVAWYGYDQSPCWTCDERGVGLDRYLLFNKSSIYVKLLF